MEEVCLISHLCVLCVVCLRMKIIVRFVGIWDLELGIRDLKSQQRSNFEHKNMNFVWSFSESSSGTCSSFHYTHSVNPIWNGRAGNKFVVTWIFILHWGTIWSTFFLTLSHLSEITMASKVVNFKVGMTCEGCSGAVTRILNKIEGMWAWLRVS